MKLRVTLTQNDVAEAVAMLLQKRGFTITGDTLDLYIRTPPPPDPPYVVQAEPTVEAVFDGKAGT